MSASVLSHKCMISNLKVKNEVITKILPMNLMNFWHMLLSVNLSLLAISNEFYQMQKTTSSASSANKASNIDINVNG